jgi:hypothetical protein
VLEEADDGGRGGKEGGEVVGKGVGGSLRRGWYTTQTEAGNRNRILYRFHLRIGF